MEVKNHVNSTLATVKMWPRLLNRGSRWIEVSNTAVYWQKNRDFGKWPLKGGEIRDTKTLNLSRNIVSLQVLVDVSRFSPCMINLIRNRNICYKSKKCSALIGWFAKSTSKFVARQVVSLMKNKQQSQNLLHKVDPRSNFRNNFLQPATNVFVARQVDYSRWKTGNVDQNLQRNNVPRRVEGFCISYFAALMEGGRLVEVRLYY